ncbi:oligosaccharide flippase family protein [Ramlibacter sp. PS4R-6]|uniref:oligosaccharide flippase family protein n=1 Tax=Ramlibacter sp. PS4R-6 TaxID=3133438 RepID=UPI00309DEFEB
MTHAAVAALAERALKWSALTTVARFVLQFAAQVALARLLGPGNFGVYGIGLAVLTFVGFLSGASFSYSLMLQPAVTKEDIRFSFTWQMIAGLASAAAMFAAAPWLARFFGDARVEGMVQLLSLASLFMAAAAPATYLLQRDLDFRRLGLIQLWSYAAGYLAVGVPMALQGYGATALGVACVVQAGVALVLTYRAKPHPVKPLFRHEHGGEALSTGKAVFLTNVVNWLLGNLDRVIIGRVLNAHAVGIFTLAYNLASIPNQLLVGALQPAFVATGAKLQDDRARLAQGWVLAIACILVLAMPAAVVMAMLSWDLVRLLYGVQWLESAWVLAVMFLCLPAWACWGLSTPVLWNTNRREYEYRLQLPLLALAAPAWWYFAPGGVRGIATVSCVVIFARAIVIVAATLRALDLRWSVLARDLGRGVGLSVLCALAVFTAQEVSSWTASPLVALFAGGIAAGLAMLAVLVFKPEALGRDAQTALSRVVPVFGPRLAPRGGTAA